MSVLTAGLVIALIILFVWIKLSDKLKWETVYETNGLRTKDAQQRLTYLQTNGVRCRLKKSGAARLIGMGGMQMSSQASVQLQVHKKQTEQAFKLLADFNK